MLGSLAGELLAEGVVLGSQAGDLGAADIEPLTERVGGCALCGKPGGWWLECPLLTRASASARPLRGIR
jgi:hypothetical protein